GLFCWQFSTAIAVAYWQNGIVLTTFLLAGPSGPAFRGAVGASLRDRSHHQVPCPGPATGRITGPVTGLIARPMAERNNKPARSDTRQITIRGAREHNLKNIDVAIPRAQLVVFTGLSGSGKSSLAFDTIYAEGQR